MHLASEPARTLIHNATARLYCDHLVVNQLGTDAPPHIEIWMAHCLMHHPFAIDGSNDNTTISMRRRPHPKPWRTSTLRGPEASHRQEPARPKLL